LNSMFRLRNSDQLLFFRAVEMCRLKALCLSRLRSNRISLSGTKTVGSQFIWVMGGEQLAVYLIRKSSAFALTLVGFASRGV